MKQEAEKLNSVLKDSPVCEMLSSYGLRMYSPIGIPAQSQQAKKGATAFNATAGVAKENNKVIYSDAIKQYFSESLTPDELFDYAPVSGKPELREAWKKDLIEKNPMLGGKSFSLPIVTGGITNSLFTVFSLFADEGDSVVMPDLYWENYDLIIEEGRGASKVTFPLFDEEGFNLIGFDKAIDSVESEKAIVLLNFPNNPTGYTPTYREAEEITSILVRHAEKGKKLVVILDDAYFSLFYEKNVCRQSLFAYLCNAHENILAVKCDGATKENMVWGFRLAFITYASRGLSDNQYDALLKKTAGVIRATVSSCNSTGQTILVKALSDSDFSSQRKAGIEKIQERYNALKKALVKFENNDTLVPLPFNSGYFMSFRTKCNAEKLRMRVLQECKGGIIRIKEDIIRFAFCSVDSDKMEHALDSIYEAALRGDN